MPDQIVDPEKEELKKINKELDEENHFKTHLLALTSHQMKTPLGIIRGYTALLRDGFYGVIDLVQKKLSRKLNLRRKIL